jgi:enhancing lycopene biosynthesis protein 2
VLTESARIARGNIKDIAKIQVGDIDAIIFPGGFGAAKNLCTFATQGADCSVNPEVERLVGEMLEARKPIGAICISPALLARILEKHDIHAKVTIGNDKDTAAAIEKMGARHIECPCASFIVDDENRVVTTPAYMLGKGPAEVFEGIRQLVSAILRLCNE